MSTSSHENKNNNNNVGQSAVIDITDLISKCAAALPMSDPFLRNDHSFSLHDSMSATQLMDRKMDCCEIPASQIYGATIKSSSNDDDEKMMAPRPIPTSLKDGFTVLPWDDLILDDAACIGLEIMIRLQALFSGSSMEESTFTCLYAHCDVLRDMRNQLVPESLEEQFKGLLLSDKSRQNAPQFTVFAMTLAMVHITSIFRGIVHNADIYEEEDFVSNSSSLEIYTEVEDMNAYRVLETALNLVKNGSTRDSIESRLLLQSLGYLFGALSVCSKLAKVESVDLENVATSIEHVGKLTISKLEYIQKQIPDFAYFKSEKAQNMLRSCFDPYINRPLLGNAPVRKSRFETPVECMQSLIKVHQEVNNVVCAVLLRADSYCHLYRLLHRYTSKAVNILGRSLVVINLYFDEKMLGKYDMRPFLASGIRQWCHIPDDMLQMPHFEAFVDRLAKPLYDTVKLLVINENRQRAFIEAVMLQDWISLQTEAQLIDTLYQEKFKLDKSTPPYATYFVLYILIDLMDRHLLLGITLGLPYHHEDLASLIWYRHYLLSAQLKQFTLMQKTKAPIVATAAALAKPPPPATATNDTKNHKKKKANKKSQSSPVAAVIAPPSPIKSKEDQEDDLFIMLLGLKRMLYSGLLRFIAVLRQANILKERRYEFTTFEKVFEKRFGVYEKIKQPPALTYQDYLAGSDFGQVSKQDLFKSTLDLLQKCKTMAEEMLKAIPQVDVLYAPTDAVEGKALLKVCIGNIAYLHRLQQIMDSPPSDDNKVTVTFDFETHKEFCTIKLS